MSKKLFIIFIILAIVLSILSLSLIKQTKTSYTQHEHSIGTSVFKNIKINEIETVKIIKSDSTTITLNERSNIKDGPSTGWTVQNLYDYPADTNKLSELLQEVINLKVIQNVRLSPHAYSELNLWPPGSKAKNKAVEIQFYNIKDELLYSLLIGKKRLDMNFKNQEQVAVGRYIRLPSQKNIILTDELFNYTNFNANDWLYGRGISINDILQPIHYSKLDRKTKTQAEQTASSIIDSLAYIEKIELSKNSSTEWILTRNTADEDFILKDTPEYIILNKQKIEAIVNSLNNLKFNSVADPKLSSFKTGLDSPVNLTISTFSGFKYGLRIGKIAKNNRYVKCKIISTGNNILTKKQLDQQKLFSKWVYLININRIDPLLSSKGSILKQEKKKRTPNNIYSRPIS